MKRINLLFLLLLAVTAGRAQITGPSVATVGTPVTFNSSVQGATYTWYPDTVDLRYNAGNIPAGSAITIRNTSSDWKEGVGSDILYDNGTYYAFIPDPLNNRLQRLNFGSDPTSNPVVTSISLAVFGLPAPLSSHQMNVNIVKDPDNNRWYGLIADHTQRIVQLDFGTSLSNAPAGKVSQHTTTASVLPGYVTLKKFNGSWLAFVCYHYGSATLGGRIVRYDFSGDLYSTPVSTKLNYTSTTQFNNIMGINLYEEAGVWYMMGVAMGGNNNIVRLRFDATLGLLDNNPSIENLGGSLASNPRSVSLLRDCNQLMFFAQKTWSNSNVYGYDFSGTITNNTLNHVFVQTTPLGNGAMTFRAFFWNDTLNYLISNTAGGLFRLPVYKYPAGTVHKYYDNTFTHTFTAPGVYNITLHVDQGLNSGPSAYCHTVTVTAGTTGPAIPDRYTAAPSPVCQGTNNVTYTVPAAGGANGYRWYYTGSNVNYAATTTQPTNTLSFLPAATAGTLRVWAVAASGDSSVLPRDTAIVVSLLPATPGNFSTSTGTVCQGQSSVTYTVPAVSTATSYTWSYATGSGVTFSGGATTTGPTNNLTFSSSATSGTLNVTAVNGCGASTARSMGITVTPLPNVGINPAVASVCAGDDITLTGTGAATYSWSHSGGNSAAATFTPATTMTYTVTGTTSGCSATATRQVVYHNLPVAQVAVTGGLTDICAGDSVILTASGSGYNYIWKGGSATVGTGSSHTVYTTGSYKVVATDISNGCSDSTQAVDIRVYNPPVVSLEHNDTSFCIGGMITLSVETQDTGLTYVWKRDDVAILHATTYFLQINESGVYKVIAGRLAAGSCEDSTNEVTVTVHDLPAVSVTWDGEVLSATPGYTSYQWRNDGQGIAGATDATYTPSEDGPYTVTVTDSNGCENTSSVQNLTQVSVNEFIVSEVFVYPNPSEGLVYIKSPVRVDVVLLSADGRILQRIEGARVVDMGGYATGMYLLRIMDAQGRVIRNERVMKQ